MMLILMKFNVNEVVNISLSVFRLFILSVYCLQVIYYNQIAIIIIIIIKLLHFIASKLLLLLNILIK